MADESLMRASSSASVPRDVPLGVRFALSALLALVLLDLAHTGFGLGGGAANPVFETWLYDATMVGCAAVCLARGTIVRGSRLPWLILGLGLACDAGGEILSSIGESFAPAAQQLLYVCLYLAAYAAIVLLGRGRMSQFRASMWLDGLIGMLAVGSLGAATLLGPVSAATHHSGAKTLLDIGYPLADMLLVGVLVAMLALSGWRVARPFSTIAFGFLIMAIADGVYLYQEAHGTYRVDTPLDALWLASALLVAYAAWQPPGTKPPSEPSPSVIVAAPALFGLTAIAVLAYSSIDSEGRLSTWLAIATLLSVLARMMLTSNENVRLIAASNTLAYRDALTGLGNRRALLQDLQTAIQEVTPAQPKLLLLFDLNGFKRYNDTFGHPAGDVLLARLGRRLQQAAEPHGSTYRLGGDEFCALLSVDRDPASLAAEMAQALLEGGERFTIGASFGEVLLGSEIKQADDALRIADQRLYAQKMRLYRPSNPEWRDVLLGLLCERDPELGTHVRQVAELALRLGRRLGMSDEALRDLVAAAEMHDIGKAAIPDAILEKKTSLDAQERAFIERHTLIGERIIASAPSGRGVAAIIRATHERYDGVGYPDGLAGERIPLAARVIAVCDAYQAMRSDRSYRGAIGEHEALAKLEHCSGSQFDPRIIDAFLEMLRTAEQQPEAAHPL
jgi:two-component system cell cycle response regulator